MLKKWLSRLLILAMIGVVIYFAVLSMQTSQVPIQARDARVGKETSATADEVQYQSFDLFGNEIASGTSRHLSLEGQNKLILEKDLEFRVSAEGQKYHFKADRFENREDGSQFMSADPGKTLYLKIENGLTMVTQGPLYHSADGVFHTAAETRFEMGMAKGSCVGLKYKPEKFLHLEGDAAFQSIGREGQLEILADRLAFDLQGSTGLVEKGILVSTGRESQDGLLRADRIDLEFHDLQKTGFRLEKALLTGRPATFDWSRGSFESNQIMACFEADGRALAEIQSGDGAHFNALTEDGGRMNGRCGPIRLTLQDGTPFVMSGEGPVVLHALRQDADLILHATERVETEFLAGRAYSTRLFGTPRFNYRELEGGAGSLRLIHSERKLMFSAGAELRDLARAVRVQGDEILLANWDGEEKEIFAYKFVRLTHLEGQPGEIRGWGEQLELKLPSRYALLRGAPAKILQGDKDEQRVQAQRIEIIQTGPELYELRTEEQVEMTLLTQQGRVEIQAKQMRYSQDKSQLFFEQVRRALIPGQGEISCDEMRMDLGMLEGKRVVDHLKAQGDVILKGQINGKNVQNYSCRGHEMEYSRSKEIIHFRGGGKDVVLTHPNGELKGSELTYFVKDGRMRVHSLANGVSTTTVVLPESGAKRQ